jgi:hypothetical protein
VFEWDTAATHAALETMDVAVFVLTADPPVSVAERSRCCAAAGARRSCRLGPADGAATA